MKRTGSTDSCEMCGTTTFGVSLYDVDGAQVSLCRRCSKFGKELPRKTSSPSGHPSRQISPGKRSPATRPSQEGFYPSPKPQYRRGFDKILRENYGEFLKTARFAAKLTRKELAAAIAEKETLLSRIEAEKLIPSDKVIEKLEKALDLELKVAEEYERPDTERISISSGPTIGSIARIKRKSSKKQN